MNRVTILGAGGMGTALAVLLARSGHAVRLWGRDPSRTESMGRSRENARHLPGIAIPEDVVITCDPRQACERAELLVVAIPSGFLRVTLRGLAGSMASGTPVLSVVKGIERETFARPSQIIVETLGSRPVAILSGPSHAEEFARGLPASVVVASTDADLGTQVREAFMSDTFRVYLNSDPLGVELAGALKNIMGIAAGICDGLAFGDNAKAALLTRGLVEFARFAEQLGARATTFWGLAGVGDALTTCYSPHGRNRRVGVEIGRGRQLAEVQAGMNDVAEGITTTRSVHEQALTLGVEMPITAEVHAILFEGKPPREAVGALMLRDPKFE